MKTKKTTKTLTLKKETITHLDQKDLDVVRGGTDSRITPGMFHTKA